MTKNLSSSNNKHIQQCHERRDINRSLQTSRRPEHITFAKRCSDNKFVHITNKQTKVGHPSSSPRDPPGSCILLSSTESVTTIKQNRSEKYNQKRR